MFSIVYVHQRCVKREGIFDKNSFILGRKLNVLKNFWEYPFMLNMLSKIKDFTTDLNTEIFFLLSSYDLHIFIA